MQLYQQLPGEDLKLDSDLALLLMAMQLHTRSNDESTESDLYGLTKAFYAYVESNNLLSIKQLQAKLLIALYEISNAIYPAAYLSAGHCARLGYTMGIHQLTSTAQLLPRPRKYTYILPASHYSGLKVG